MPLPTIAEIRELRRAAESYWRRLHEEMEADYKEVDEGPGVKLSLDGEEQSTLNPHTAWVKVSTACNHLIDSDIEIRVDSGAQSKAHRQKGESISAALKALHYHLTSDAKSDPHRAGLFDAATTGMGVWYVGTDFSRLLAVDARKPPQEEEKDEDYDQREDVQAWKEERSHTLPLILDHEDPRTIFPDPATHGDRYVMKIEKRLVGDVRRNWAGWDAQLKRNGKRKSDFDEVEWFELWSAPGGLGPDDPGSYYYESDGIPIKRFGTPQEQGEEIEETPEAGPWPHNLGFCPFVVWSAGYGMPAGKPESMYKGLVRNARRGGLFRAKAEKRSQFHAMSERGAWHGWAVPQGTGGNFNLNPGAVNEMPVEDGKMIVPSPIVGPPPAASLFTEAAALDADIDAETVSDVLSAPGEEGSEVALLYARKVQEAAMALGPLRRNAERGYDQVWERIGRILANADLFGDEDQFSVVGMDGRGNPVAHTISRRLFAGTHIYRTTIDPRFATDQIGRTQNGALQVREGLIDPVTHHREYSGLSNPEQIVRRAYAHKVFLRQLDQGLFDPFVKAFASGQLPKDIKGREWFVAMMNAEKQAADQIAAGGSAPSIGPSGRQADGPPGNGMVRPGGGFVDVGASDALSEQLPSNGQGPTVV